jgi:hypothetical protein
MHLDQSCLFIVWTQKIKIKTNKLKSLFFVLGRVNYILHKLSGNTNHVQFQLYMSPW